MILNHNNEYLGFVYVGEYQEISPKSSKKLPFKCRCGKTKLISIRYITIGDTKKCGHCNDIVLNNGDLYHNFVYTGNTVTIGPKSSKKLPFKCRCGKTKLIRLANIVNGNTTSCNECLFLTLNTGDKIGKLTYTGDRTHLGPNSRKKLPFKCTCGRN